MSETQDIQAAIERSQSLTAQSIPNSPYAPAQMFMVQWLARAGMLAPPWWSPSRDMWLRRFWKENDHLSGTIYTMVSKMTAIPVKVIPKDMNDPSAVLDAQIMTDIVNDAPGFGAGWCEVYGKFVEDLVSTDNGGFLEVIGAGPKDGPIIGMPVSIAHLDSNLCTRTGNATYPVIYTDTDGKRYKLHSSRVMFASQMPSTIATMLGVGFCSSSRCLGAAQNLADIVIFKQEKLGSRPHRKIIITQGGLDPSDLESAFNMAASKMDSAGLKRYSQIVVSGSRTIPDAKVAEIELANMPDGFNEDTSMTYGMATIALAFGMDARELFPAMQSGATRADALLQHLKQRGKGPGQILQLTERMMNFKFIPNHLLFVTDFQDDAQDRQTAEIRKIRADKRVQDKATESENQRTAREQMVMDGDITQEQFMSLELEDGRLPNGDPALSLCFKKKSEYSQYLSFPGIKNPLDTFGNDPIAMQEAIAENKAKVLDTLANTTSNDERWIARQCQSTLNELEVLYTPAAEAMQAQEQAMEALSVEPNNNEGAQRGNGKNPPGRPPKPGMKRVLGHQYIDPRNRRTDLTTPTATDNANAEGS